MRYLRVFGIAFLATFLLLVARGDYWYNILMENWAVLVASTSLLLLATSVCHLALRGKLTLDSDGANPETAESVGKLVLLLLKMNRGLSFLQLAFLILSFLCIVHAYQDLIQNIRSESGILSLLVALFFMLVFLVWERFTVSQYVSERITFLQHHHTQQNSGSPPNIAPTVSRSWRFMSYVYATGVIAFGLLLVHFHPQASLPFL